MTTSSTRPALAPSPADGGMPRDLQATLEDTVVSSPNCIELLDTPAIAYQQRLATVDRSIAELYHVNSRLRRSSPSNQPADPALLGQVRDWFHRTAYRPDPEDVDAARAESLGVRRDSGTGVVGSFVAALEPYDLGASTFAIDIWLIVDDRAMRLSVDRASLWLERVLMPGDVEQLERAITGFELPDDVTLGFLVAAPWRYQMFVGPRGYRHCLVEAGRVLAEIERLAPPALPVVSTLDFFDDEIEAVLGLDGLERTVVAAFAVTSTKGADR